MPKAVLALTVLLLAGCQRETPGSAPRVESPAARPVRAHTLAIEPVQVTLEAVGSVRSKTQTVVAGKVLGYVREVRVSEGERVRSGDLLVAVDQAEPRTRVARAQAALSEASRSADEAQRNLDEARAALLSAEADHRHAETTATRFRRLLAQELISVQEFDGVEAGAVRFRPMLLTASAVVVGASVMLFDPIFQGLAISLMAGEVASTLLSRLAVPVLYYLAERGREP